MPDQLSHSVAKEAEKTGVLNVIRQVIPSAVLAPSAHNAQPWRFQVTRNLVDIFVDWDRHLEVSDPTNRQLYVSIGCAVANATIAAKYWGYRVDVTPFPDGPSAKHPAVRLTLTRDPNQSTEDIEAQFAAIAQRRTDRSLYNQEPLTQDERQKLTITNHVKLIEEREDIEAIGELTEQATLKTLSRRDFKEELSHWVRNSWTRQNDGMPGYAMGIPGPVSLVAPIMVRLAPIHKQEAPKTREEMNSASVVAVITTPTDSPNDWLIAGQTLQNLWLSATAAGLAAMPLVAAVEAGEDIRSKLQQTIGTTGCAQSILRIGHSQKNNLRATPRRTVEDCLK